MTSADVTLLDRYLDLALSILTYWGSHEALVPVAYMLAVLWPVILLVLILVLVSEHATYRELEAIRRDVDARFAKEDKVGIPTTKAPTTKA